jgi:hypothetical protein
LPDDLGVELFNAARSQSEQARKWHLILVLAVAYLHVALVIPFAAKTAEKSGIDRELHDTRALDGAISPIVALTGDLAGQAKLASDDTSKALLTDLVARFSMLNEIVIELARIGVEAAGGVAGENLFTLTPPGTTGRLSLQRVPMAVPDIDLYPMSAELRRYVARTIDEAGAEEESLALLVPYIEDQVIRPAFERATRRWEGQHLPEIHAKAAALAKEIAAVRDIAAAAAIELDSLAKAVATLESQAEALALAPPSDPEWWRSVAAKEGSIRGMMAALASRIGEVEQQTGGLAALEAQIAETVRQREIATNSVITDLAELEEQAKALQAQLGEIGAPLKVVAFKLSVLAPLLPLIIAGMAGAISIWSGETLRRMRLAASLVVGLEERRVSRAWLGDTAGGTLFLVVARELILGLLLIAWVLIAARTSWTLGPSGVSHPLVMLLAIVTLIASRSYHGYQAARAVEAGEDARRDCRRGNEVRGVAEKEEGQTSP